MLNARTVFDRDGISVSDVRCSHAKGAAPDDEPAPENAVVFVRRGCFVRSAAGGRQVLDPTLAYCMHAGEEQRYDHPHADGDDCTAIALSPDLVASLWGGDPALPTAAIPTSSEIDLRHRLLLSAAGASHDEHELYERALALLAATLAVASAIRVSAGRPATARARRTIVESAREALTERPDRSLPELARITSTSPHHLSRVFRAEAGHTISRQRIRLRARAALDRLADGDENLARLAADVGFADQSHLCRVLVEETGRTPSALRRALSHV